MITVSCWLTLAALAATPAGPNLLNNSGFELGGLAGWQAPADPGVEAVADASVAHAGQHSCRISVPASVPVSWYSASQGLSPKPSGAILTISAFVRTREVQDGAGAYLSLSFFDADGKRISFADSPGHRRGTSEWQRMIATARVPEGTAEIKAIVLVHGHGSAWFDDVQVEEAGAASEYRPSAPDLAAQARREALEMAARRWREAFPRPAGKERVAVLAEAFPAGDNCPSDPEVLAGTFARAGYATALLDAEVIANPLLLSPAEIDLLVVPCGDAFPAEAHGALVGYLREGGAMLTAGGFAFDRPLIRFQGKWMAAESLPVGDGPAAAIFPSERSGWRTGTNRATQPILRQTEGPAGRPAIELRTEALDLWEVALLPVPRDKLPAGWSVIRFWAKGDARTERMEFECQEEDGSRWSTTLSLSPGWTEFTFFPGDLTHRTDSPARGRGGKGDQFHPEKLRGMQFGFSAGCTARGLPHSIWVAGATVQVDAACELRKPSPRINTRWAPIRDALWPEPEQIGVFDPSFRLQGIASTRAAAGQDIVSGFQMDGPLLGYSAVGMLGLNGHGFGPNRARWIPLLECLDRSGRPRGHAGAVLHHFTGTFAGSSWAIFGATDRDLFVRDSPALERVLLPVAAHLLDKLYLHETDTGYACYRQGETVNFRTRVSNFSRRHRKAEVRIDTGAGEVLASRPVELMPGETVPVELSWKPGRFPADYCGFAAELWEGGRRIDREEGAFVAWTPGVLAQGPRLEKDGTRFLVDGRAQFLLGCQTYWGQNGSVTARSPAAFDRDFRQMRDLGLRWTRLFLPFKTEEDRRISDAAVQLAQKHGLVLYHTPNLRHTADAEELAGQRDTAREISARYREVPGLAIDLCNEPSFRAGDPALRKRCGEAGRTDGPWTDLDSAAFWRCMADAERAWEKANLSGAREGHAARLISVGWSQGWGGGEVMKDPVLSSLDLDFTDRHYYGPPARLIEELKDLDQRSLGKPFILGECGAKNHPTFHAADPWGMGDDDARYDARFLFLGHHAFGLGAAAAASWHWRDPMEGAFPCGLLQSTGVPRPTAAVWRAMAHSFAPVKPKSVTPEVCLLLADEARMGGQRDQVLRALHRATNLLVTCRAGFSLLPDSELGRLPKETKAVVYPLPLNPSDAILDRLQSYVKAGGWLYLAGDISYDAQRRPCPPARLQRLFGVEKTAGAATPLEPVSLRLAGAEAVEIGNGCPVLTRFRQGAGEAWFSGDLIELAPEQKPEHAARYRRFLEAAGVSRVLVTPERDDLRAYRVEGEEGLALVFYNEGEAVTASYGGVGLELAAQSPGYLLLGPDGSVQGVETQGQVTRAGKPLLRVQGHAFVLAGDGLDLARSRSLQIFPIGASEVRWAGVPADEAKAEAEAGETRDGKWHPLARLPLQRDVDQWVIPIPEVHARDMIRVSLPGRP